MGWLLKIPRFIIVGMFYLFLGVEKAAKRITNNRFFPGFLLSLLALVILTGIYVSFRKDGLGFAASIGLTVVTPIAMILVGVGTVFLFCTIEQKYMEWKWERELKKGKKEHE